MSERTIQEVLDVNPGCKRFTFNGCYGGEGLTRKWICDLPSLICHHAIIPGLRPVQRDRLEELREMIAYKAMSDISRDLIQWAIAKIEAARENCKRQLERGSGYGHAEGCGCTHCTHARDFLKD